MQVTLDVVKLGYAYFVNQDCEMRSTNDGKPCYANANSTALGEELGQVIIFEMCGTKIRLTTVYFLYMYMM